MVTNAGLVSGPALSKSVPYDPLKDFSYLTLNFASHYLIVTQPKSGITTAAQLQAKAKAEPGKLTFGSTGMGTGYHLAIESFVNAAGVSMLHVPYKGNAPAMADVMGGQLSMMMDIISTASTYIHGGRVHPIAVTSPARNASLPDVPTFAESGIEGLKGFDVGGWYGVYGPKGMAPELVGQLNQSINAALAQPELRKRFKEMGYEEWTGSPQKLADRGAKERAMWATVTPGIVVD